MRNLVEHILNREYDAANQIFESEIETVTEIKLNEAKKMVAARMSEQVPAFMGAAAGNAVKLRRGVLEEDDLDEMDLSREKPDYSSIEDRRGQSPNAKAGQWWAKNHWKEMGQKVSQKQADDINSGRLKSRGPFDNLDTPRQKSTGYTIGGARPGVAGKNSQSISGAIFQKKELKEEELYEDADPEPKNVLRKRMDAARGVADNAVKPWSNLVTDYGHNSNIGKKATSYFSGLKAKADKAEQDYDHASKNYRKDLDLDRVTNKLSDVAKNVPKRRPEIEKLHWQAKASRYGGEYAKRRPSETEPLKEESEELDEARIKIQKARVRGGKVQRRRKVSNVEGHKIVDGKLKRMSPAERRRRKLGAKRGKLKRRSKMRLALMKRKRSLRKRASIGL